MLPWIDIALGSGNINTEIKQCEKNASENTRCKAIVSDVRSVTVEQGVEADQHRLKRGLVT